MWNALPDCIFRETRMCTKGEKKNDRPWTRRSRVMQDHVESSIKFKIIISSDCAGTTVVPIACTFAIVF